jgi:hypothetical protein
MNVTSIHLAPKSFAVCIFEGVFTSDYGRIYPDNIFLHTDMSVTIYLEQDEAKRLAARFGKMVPDLNVGFAKQFRDKKKDLEKQILQLEKDDCYVG